MKTFVVYHFIHVRTPYQYRAKLFVTDVPEVVRETEVKSAIVRAGYYFGEFGVEWANHYVEEMEEDSNDQLWRSWNQKLTETTTWSSLRERAGFSVDDLSKKKRQVRDKFNKFDFNKNPSVLDSIERLLGGE